MRKVTTALLRPAQPPGPWFVHFRAHSGLCTGYLPHSEHLTVASGAGCGGRTRPISQVSTSAGVYLVGRAGPIGQWWSVMGLFPS